VDETPENRRSLENSVDSSWVRVGSHQYFAKEHLRAAQFMAESCQRREQQCERDGITGLDRETRYYALAAIVESTAFLEAVVNELWHDVSTSADIPNNPYLEGLDQRAVGTLRELGTKSRVERSLNVLDKYDLTLLCAGEVPIDRGRSPAQDVVALIKARNALVHFKPEMHWDDDVHDLERQIKHRVPPNPLMQGAGPWFPHHLLGAGVARWAWENSVELVEEWRQSLGLVMDYKTRGPSYWTTAEDG
jgi:hypothetical protein